MTFKERIGTIKQSSLFKDSFWALFGNAVGKGLALIAGIAIARFLGSEAYGEYGLIKGTLLSIAIFSSFGLGYTATKFIAECRHTDLKRVYAIHKVSRLVTLCSSAFIAALVSIFAQPIAEWLKDAALADILRWSAIAVIFNAIITTQTGELSGFRAYKTVARNNIISGVLTFFFVAPAAYFGGLLWAIIALVITLFINCLINSWSLHQLLPHSDEYRKLKVDVPLYKEVISFSLPIALQECLYSVTSWLGMAMLIRLAGYAELGIYSAANQWMAVMLFIPGALRNVALSHLSENSRNPETSKRISNRLILVNFISTFIPFLIIAVLSKWIASFYGQSFIRLPMVLNVCIFTAVISSMSNVITQDLIAHSRNWYLFSSRFLRDSITLIAAYFAITKLDYSAAVCFAMAMLTAQTIYLIALLIKRNELYKSCAE